jgi:peptidoglycan-associated lipoprotein
MQNVPLQATSGPIAAAISGRKKDKDVLVVSGLIASLAAVIGGVWYYSSTEQIAQQDQMNNSQVSEALRITQPLLTPVSISHSPVEKAPDAPTKPRVVHTDLYFEVGRKGLTDEARTLLREQVSMLMDDASLGVLIQGYTDQQGSASYNKTLGLKRAEAVKTELLNAGVLTHRIRTVSLGKEGALCIDDSDVCRQMNRRVHLEIRSIGEERMRPPVHSAAPDGIQEPADSGPNPDTSNPLLDHRVPSSDAGEPDNGTLATEPGSGS